MIKIFKFLSITFSQKLLNESAQQENHNSSLQNQQQANNISNNLNINLENNPSKKNLNTADKDQKTLLNFEQFLSNGNNNSAANFKNTDCCTNELKFDLSFGNPGFVNIDGKNANNLDKMDIDEGNQHENLNYATEGIADKTKIDENEKPKFKKAKQRKTKEENKENSEGKIKEELKSKTKKATKNEFTPIEEKSI